MADAVARAWLTGTPEEPIINLDLPAGPKGEPGGWNVGTGLGDRNLDDITTPGLYHQADGAKGLSALNYPREKAAGALQVYSWNGGLFQEFTLIGATPTPATSGKYIRSTRGSVWTSWAFYPIQRVDNTAGKAIYTWDDTINKEQMIYGVSGVRNITSLAAGLNTTTESGGDPAILLSREGSTVTLMFENAKPLANGDWNVFSGLPVGFRPKLKNPQRYFILASTNSTVSAKSMFFYTSGAMVVFGAASTDVYRQTITYPTVDAWPTTLPGIPL